MALQIGTVIHVVMKDGSSVIATGDDEVERAVNIEARFTGHARGGMGRRCN